MGEQGPSDNPQQPPPAHEKGAQAPPTAVAPPAIVVESPRLPPTTPPAFADEVVVQKLPTTATGRDSGRVHALRPHRWSYESRRSS